MAGVALAADGAAGEAGLITSRTTWAVPRLVGGVQTGMAAQGVAGPTVRSVGPVRDEEAATTQVRALLDAGVRGIVSLTGALDAAVRDVVVDVPVTVPQATTDPADGTAPTPSPSPAPDRFAGLVAGPEARSLEDGAEVPAPLLLVLETHLEEAVALAVTRHLDGWSTEPASIGMSDGAFRVTVTDSARGTALAATIDDVVTRLRSGELTVPSG